MSITKTISRETGTVIIKIGGVFDLSQQNAFRKIYESEQPAKKYILDLCDAEYMDSAAFGMLLVFRDYVGGSGSDISIVNANPDIKKSFQLLNFTQLFSLK